MLDKFNERLNHYLIMETMCCIGEDGKYLEGDGDLKGYAVVNKANDITEFTTQVLPTAIFQADYLDKALTSLLEDKPEAPIAEVATDDVMLN